MLRGVGGAAASLYIYARFCNGERIGPWAGRNGKKKKEKTPLAFERKNAGATLWEGTVEDNVDYAVR